MELSYSDSKLNEMTKLGKVKVNEGKTTGWDGIDGIPSETIEERNGGSLRCSSRFIGSFGDSHRICSLQR